MTWIRNNDVGRSHKSFAEQNRKKAREMEEEKKKSNRINVTAVDAAKRLAEVEGMSWDDQKEKIRVESALALAIISGGGEPPPGFLERLSALQKVSGIVKHFLADDRRSGAAAPGPDVDLDA